MAPPLLLLLVALLGPCGARAPAATNASAAPTVQVTLGVVLPEDSRRCPWSWPRVAPALSLALEALQPQLRYAGLAVRTAFASWKEEDGGCDKEVPLFKAMELKGSHDPDVLLGPGCFSYLLEDFGLYWQLPILQAGARLHSKSDSLPGPGVVYAGPQGPGLPDFQEQLFQRFNWTHRAVLVYGRHTDFWRYYGFLWFLGMRFPLIGMLGVVTRYLQYEEPDAAVRYIQAEGRVVFLSLSLEELHQLMHLAHAQNMTNGDYVFFCLDLFGESLRAVGHREARKPWQSNMTQDKGGLREAFQTVLVITPHEPQTPQYQHFEKEVVLRAQRDFGVAINDSLGHLVAGCYHDVLLLYLKALNETLHEGGTKRDTSLILDKMRSLKFQGVTGMVNVNMNNEQETDFDLWAMRDVETGGFQVVAHYIASEKRIIWMGGILWKKGESSLDNPPCVFDQEDPSCVKRECAQGERDLPFRSFCSPSLLPQELVLVC